MVGFKGRNAEDQHSPLKHWILQSEEGSRNLCSDQRLCPASAEQGAASALRMNFKPGADPLLERKFKPSHQLVFRMSLKLSLMMAPAVVQVEVRSLFPVSKQTLTSKRDRERISKSYRKTPPRKSKLGVGFAK